MDKEKYRRLFVDEARENLNSYSNELTAMQKAAPGERGAGLDAVFRAAHSLKGMAASMGYGPFADLAHALEDLADKGRQGVELDEEAVELLLESGDVLSEMVDQVEQGGEEALDAADLPERLRAKQAALSDDPAPPVPAADPSAAFAGKTGMVIVVRMDASAANVNVRAFMAHRALSGLDGYEETSPSVDAIKSGEAGAVFALRYAEGTDSSAVIGMAAKQEAVADAKVLSAADIEAAPAPGPAPSLAAEGEPPGEEVPPAQGERVLEVQLDDSGALPQVRAFMIHRAASALGGYRRTDPSVADIRRGAIPAWTLRFGYEPSADLEAHRAALEQEQGVAAVRIAQVQVPAAAEPEQRRKEDDRTVRIRTVLLDDFIDSVGELLIARARLRAMATKLDAPELSDIVDEIERMTRDLHDRVVTARMTPLATITDRFPPTVRSLARKLKKRVEFSIAGAEIELDRAILDELSTPLLHMLRNAVDHAHEGTEAREAAGKPATMTLKLVASRDRDFVHVTLDDDGAGIDAEKVKARALDRGLISAEQAAGMSEAEAVELICTPGFTTAAQVSETSGRGVGMDVVKSTLEKVGGSLRIRSELGKGTTFTLRLPLTVAIIQVLVVEAGPERSCVYAIPITRVDRALDIAPAHVRESHGRRHLVLGDDLIPLFDLAGALGFDGAPIDTGTAILVGEEEESRAFSVGAVLGQEEVVVKPLGSPLGDVDFLAGAALLADGRTAYILEPTRLGR
jgi:two-component system chemotaxis sensor kinase CheA